MRNTQRAPVSVVRERGVLRSVTNALTILEAFTERYCLGFKAFEVGSRAAGRGAIREVTAPFLRHLMLASKETVHLVDRFLRRRLKSYTPSTLTDPGEFRRELLRIRAVGHALDDEEFAVGLRCLAAPLRDHTRGGGRLSGPGRGGCRP